MQILILLLVCKKLCHFNINQAFFSSGKKTSSIDCNFLDNQPKEKKSCKGGANFFCSPDDHRRQWRKFFVSNICARSAACLWHITQHRGLTSVSSASASDSLRPGAPCAATPQIDERASEEPDWVETGHSRATAAAIPVPS